MRSGRHIASMNKTNQTKETAGAGQNRAEIEYQLAVITRILTVWYEIENAAPIFE
jgi:hypothetical protein